MSTAARRFARWSQLFTAVELSRLLGVDPTYVYHLRAGRRVPSLRVAVTIETLTRGWDSGPIAPRDWIPAVEEAAA